MTDLVDLMSFMYKVCIISDLFFFFLDFFIEGFINTREEYLEVNDELSMPSIVR